MSFVNVAPDVVTEAGANLDSIGSSLRSAYSAAAAPTTAIAAPAADEVSRAITSSFGTSAQEFQALSTQAAAFHEQFVGTLNAAVGKYVGAEAANVQQTLVGAVNAPAQALLGHPLIGTGHGAAAPISINTPLGAITFSYSASLPPAGQNGAFSVSINASTPFGGASGGLSGNVSNGPSGPGTQYSVTGGTLNAPWLSTLVSGTGAPLAGGVALGSGLQTSLTDLTKGNLLGAAVSFGSIPANVATAVTVGNQTLTIPVNTANFLGPQGPTVDVNIPLPGVFSSPQPITVSWPTFNYTSDGTTYTVVGNNLALGGTQLGGSVPSTGATVVGAAVSVVKGIAVVAQAVHL